MSHFPAQAVVPPAPLLSREQVEAYVNDGYLVVPGLVSREELDEIKADTLKLARGGYPAKQLEPLAETTRDAEVLGQILCIHQPHSVSPVMERYARHTGIVRALSQITAAHLPFWDGSVKCMQTMLFVKPPGFQGQAWHQDECYIPTRDRSLVGAWIAVDDATVENGCMHVIPRSHRSGYLYPQRAHARPDEWDSAHESFGFDDSENVPVQVEAGSVVFFNGYLLHGSYKNRTSSYRRALVSHYMNAYSLLPWRHPKGAVPTSADDVRKVIAVSGVDPYAWKGYERPSDDVYLRRCLANGGDRRDQRIAVAQSQPQSSGQNGP